MLRGSRIRELRDRKGWSQDDLAERVGVTREAVSQWESEGTHPRGKNLRALALAFGINTQNLYADSNASETSTNSVVTEVVNPTPPSDTDLNRGAGVPSIGAMPRNLPVMGVTVGGSDGDFSLNGETVDYVRRPPGTAPGTFALYVQGESMYPRYKRGELVLVSDARPARPGDDVIIELHPDNGDSAGRCLLKELIKVSADSLTLREFYPQMREFTVARATVRKLWRIYSPTEYLASG